MLHLLGVVVVVKYFQLYVLHRLYFACNLSHVLFSVCKV